MNQYGALMLTWENQSTQRPKRPSVTLSTTNPARRSVTEPGICSEARDYPPGSWYRLRNHNTANTSRNIRYSATITSKDVTTQDEGKKYGVFNHKMDIL